MDTHGDMLDIDSATDFRRLVIDCLAKLILDNGKSFKFHVEQCKSLCRYIVDKLSPYLWNNEQYLGRNDVWSRSVQRSWKEIYRAMKEAEAYLKNCSTEGPPMESILAYNTGEAFTLHMHDLAWSRLCLDLNVLGSIEKWENRRHCGKARGICDFFAEMSGLHIQQFGFEFQDYWHLLMACNQTAAKAGTLKKKNKIGFLQFMEGKVLETIRNECKINSTTGTPAWEQIPVQDLIPKRKAIGKGSFGEVHEGSWLGHKVAVKEIPIAARDLFDRETAVLAKLHCPFIVQLIGTCVEGSHCYIVMELVSSSLDKLLMNSAGRTPLSLPVAVDMMLQISRGMEYLHRQGVMHMDLKASNVLIEPSAVPEFRKQGYGRVKLCDFGMASLRLSSFRCEDPKGTCYWRAPEAFPFPNEELLHEIDTLSEYTYKADVYSFAMTCYEILTGKQPFLGVHPKDLYRMIVQGRRPVLKRSACPAVLAKYIQKCWETDPGLRPCFAQVSTFLRNMKLFIQRMNDPRDWLEGSGTYFYSSEVFLELVRYTEEAFDESPADEKMKSITRLLQIVPTEIKRRYNIEVAGAVPSEKSNARKDNSSPAFCCTSLDRFDLEDLRHSTAEALGKGSFGTTYRANLHGFSVVVKRLSKNAAYVGDKIDFERRLQALTSLKHTNLVCLQAYHISKEEKLFVYNYLPTGSLYSLLHTEIKPLKWDRRMRIAVGVAKGLAFLHKSGIAHGNVKSSNILLDNDGNACLADYCLAGHVKISSVAEKSSGYNSGKMCKESDVYSFGVLLIELVTGKNPSSVSTDLLRWILSIEKERWIELFDVRLEIRWGDMQETVGMLEVAVFCASARPMMSNVVKMINDVVKSHNKKF